MVNGLRTRIGLSHLSNLVVIWVRREHKAARYPVTDRLGGSGQQPRRDLNTRSHVQNSPTRWLAESNLEGIRETEELARLPEDEQGRRVEP